jgi:hypothetical protein
MASSSAISGTKLAYRFAYSQPVGVVSGPFAPNSAVTAEPLSASWLRLVSFLNAG